MVIECDISRPFVEMYSCDYYMRDASVTSEEREEGMVVASRVVECLGVDHEARTLVWRKELRGDWRHREIRSCNVGITDVNVEAELSRDSRRAEVGWTGLAGRVRNASRLWSAQNPMC